MHAAGDLREGQRSFLIVANAAFGRMRDSLLARLGEQAVLRGESVTPADRAIVRRNAEVTTATGDVVIVPATLALSRLRLPATGDRVDLVDPADGTTVLESFVLDRLIRDNGVMRTFVARTA